MALRKKEQKKDIKSQVRVVILPLNLDRDIYNRLTNARREAALVWNACVQIAQHLYFEDKHWVSEAELRKMLSGQFNLHSQCVQNVIEQYCDNRETTGKLRRQGLTQWKYPYKTKHYFPVVWSSQGVTLSGKTILLKMGRGRKPIVIDLSIALTQVNRVELVYKDNRYYLHCAVTQDSVKPEKPGSKAAAIDLGEIHAMTITDGEDALIVTGRKLRAIKQYRAKRLAEIQYAMSGCKKNSCRWKKLLRAKRKMLTQTARQIHDLNHKITRKVTDWCKEHRIGRVFIGNLEGVQRNISPKKKSTPKKKRKSRKVNQKLSTWEFGKQTQLLKYKLSEIGVSLSKKDEAYTSQTCPECGHRHKPKGRVFKCRCGYTEHRDVVGALNFLRKCKQGEMKPQPTRKINTKYLRPFAFRQRKVVVPAEPLALPVAG